MLTIWVEGLLISQKVAQKIRERHGITSRQVREAVVRVAGLDFSWDFQSDRGVRAIVRTRIGDREENEALIMLYPTENPADQTWRLGSAYYILG